MFRFLLTISLLSLHLLYARTPFKATVFAIDKTIEKRMRRGGSYRDNCPVTLEKLRYIQMTYLGFDGKAHQGEMIVHRDVAREVVTIFRRLYEMRYPVRSMRLVSDFGANDFASIEADNTSAFNCREATGSKHWSKHAYGKAIDLNPIENPYVSKAGRTAHRASKAFLTHRARLRHNASSAAIRAVLTKNAPAVAIFKRYGWRWGGDWHGIKDYQHFDKR